MMQFGFGFSFRRGEIVASKGWSWRAICVCFEEEPGRRSEAKLLNKDEARRIADNVAKLPDLLEPDWSR